MAATPSPRSRLAYIDWLRGLACVVMFQTHCYDAWLSPEARKGQFFVWSQVGGTLPAPLFLFLAGFSSALVIERAQQKGLTPAMLAGGTIRRGAEVLGLGLLFRLQEYVIAWGWAPWSDLLRVDVLNTIGASIILLGVLCWMVLSLAGKTELPRITLALASAATALAISLLTPLLWTSWRPRWLPWPVESYINGVHNLNQPQAWIFPIFPWAGFAFAGLAVGLLLRGGWFHDRPGIAIGLAGLGGIGLIGLSRWLDVEGRQYYPAYDYWHTSPSFFLLRVGMLLLVLAAGYAWCRWGPGLWGFSPLVQLGQTSMLVYWVHLEFVYGRFTILPRQAQSIRTASAGLLIIFLAMLLLSMLRTRFKGRGAPGLAWLRSPAG